MATWWRHEVETFSALLVLCERNLAVTGGFPFQRPVTRSFSVLYDLCSNKRLSKQSRRRWFKTPPRSLLRQCNERNAFGYWIVSPGNLFGVSRQHCDRDTYNNWMRSSNFEHTFRGLVISRDLMVWTSVALLKKTKRPNYSLSLWRVT